MTNEGPATTNAQIECILTAKLDDTHLGKHVAFYADGKRHFGVLEALYQRAPGIRTLTLSSGRVRDLRASTEVEVITGEATA